MRTYEQWAETNLRIASRSGVEWTCWCNSPSHDDTTPSMSFNVEKGLWICYSCGHKGSVAANGYVSVPEFDFEEEMKLVREKLEALETGDGEKRLRKIEEGSLARYRVETDYWKSRGISQKTQKRFQLGYDFTKDAVTIPVRDVRGRLQGVTHRFLGAHEGGKYHYPFEFKKSQELFASWMVAKDPNINRVVITEGAIDTMKLWQLGIPSLAIYGAQPSKAQIDLLNLMGVNEVVLFLDNDREGRNAKNRCLGYWKDKKTGRYTYKRETDMGQSALVWVVDYKLDVKDLGEMSDYAIKRHVDKAVRII